MHATEKMAEGILTILPGLRAAEWRHAILTIRRSRPVHHMAITEQEWTDAYCGMVREEVATGATHLLSALADDPQP